MEASVKFRVVTHHKMTAGETVIIGVFEKPSSLTGAAASLDTTSGGMIRRLIEQGDFTGKLNQTLPIFGNPLNPDCRILLVGLGREEEFTPDRLRSACGSAARAARERNARGITIPYDFVDHPSCPVPQRVRAYVEGVRLGLYRFLQFKTKDGNNDHQDPIICTITIESPRDLVRVRAEVKKAEAIADAVCMARDLVNMPGNVATPSFLAAQARSIARRSGLRCRVLDRRALRRIGMNAFLSVALGSDEPPCFIILEYRPRSKKQRPPIVLIGKAVTFDSGGISLKPAQDMNEMKTDMAGGAAVLAVLQACSALAIPLPVVGLIPAGENLPSGHALKPGDIVSTMSGTTVEIITTDAEGRLMLADALTYAQRYKPAAVIDIATLTGACVIALGNEAAGLMGTDADLVRRIQVSADRTGERVWELPLWREYAELLKSDVADIKNASGRQAGAITGGSFLKRFAGTTPWAHLDIAGTAWTKKALPCAQKGATGTGVRLLVDVLEHWDER